MQSNQIVYPKALPWLAAGAILFAIGVLIGLWYQPYPELGAVLFSENGEVETPEMIALGLSMLVFIFRAIRSNDPVGAICIGIAFLLAIAMVRETPRCNSSLYEGGLCFPTQVWKNGTIGVFVAVAAAALWSRRHHLRTALTIRQLHVFWPMWVAFVLLVSAEVGEKLGLLGMEETLELFVYLYLVAFGIWMHRNS